MIGPLEFAARALGDRLREGFHFPARVRGCAVRGVDSVEVHVPPSSVKGSWRSEPGLSAWVHRVEQYRSFEARPVVIARLVLEGGRLVMTWRPGGCWVD